MSSPILGDSPSVYDHPEREQITSKHMPLEKHNTSLRTNTSTGPNPIAPGDEDSAGHVVRAQCTTCHHQSPRGDCCSEKGWKSEFFPNGEDPGTRTEMNSPTRYEDFSSAPQSESLRGPGHGTRPTRKPQGRRNAKKSTQSAREPERSGKIQKKQSERPRMDGNTSRTASGRSVTPRIQKALQLFREQLGLLEEQNKRRLDASQGEPSEKRI
ncbi:hypothetical protein BGZ61DRAFT_524552 [Ilyonectria robusta]|uniref:uncharacterized protein n=1 Tax=Ilyonectria robusta TaxID=1079257 RepID=UPI001E8CF78F|nr:uncharacterized protein BGZ61DRAFT_524552 [Ilyonectria robusta]KAH8651729.1 hypothetical protein BGZ61DRAFT_524552 [Ilyonectria robusta]